jgi:putative SOS response-associated peptidase YedK
VGRQEDRRKVESYTKITTEPNELVGQVHGRMPLILHKEDEDTWLNPDITEPELLQPLLKPYPADKMEGWRVGDAPRNWRNDEPSLIQPVGEYLTV